MDFDARDGHDKVEFNPNSLQCSHADKMLPDFARRQIILGSLLGISKAALWTSQLPSPRTAHHRCNHIAAILATGSLCSVGGGDSPTVNCFTTDPLRTVTWSQIALHKLTLHCYNTSSHNTSLLSTLPLLPTQTLLLLRSSSTTHPTTSDSFHFFFRPLRDPCSPLLSSE